MSKYIPWIIKYRPKKIAEVLDQEEAKKLIVPWLKKWLAKQIPEKKAALFYGPPGCGKTALAEAAAKEYKLEYVEMNASDFRSRRDIERVAKIAASKASLFGFRGKIILLDEVDGISGTADFGALDAILELIEVSRHPIILTANDPWDPRLRPLRDVCLLVPFKRLPKRVIIKALENICQSEGLEYEKDALRYIAEKARGDLRSAINDLQAVSIGLKKITLEDAQKLIRERYREYDPFETLRKIFTAKYAWQAKMAATTTNLDYEMLLQWINENLPYQYSDPEDLWRGYEALSRADVYLGRIVKSGDWSLLSYAIEMMTAGVAFARKKTRYKWVKYGFPQRILMMAKAKKLRELREAVAKVLGEACHISRRRAKTEVIPFVMFIFRNNPDMAAKIAISLNMSKSMVKYLAGDLYKDVIKRMRRE